VGNSQHLKIGTGQFIEAGNEIHLSSGLKVVLEAGSELSFKAGGSFIKLDASGITMVGPVIKINSGGAPGNGSGAAPIAPTLPKPADTAPVGEKIGTANLNPLPAPTEKGVKGPQQLIVDVWGDPEQGGQVELLNPEGDA
jgi:type VI secretion system secreted protein VgrG